MIITRNDLDEFEEFYERYLNSRHDQDEEEVEFLAWLNDNPQILMATFQEYVGAHDVDVYHELIEWGELRNIYRPMVRMFEGRWLLPSVIGISKDCLWDAYSLDGMKTLSEYEIPDDELQSEFIHSMCSFNDLYSKAELLINNPLLDPTTFISPSIWTPAQHDYEKNLLQNSMQAILHEIQTEGKSLQELHWRQFEELVAELLRQQGMTIHMVKESPQGGRDIIARSEVVPGEPITIAIEVKHKCVVDRTEVQMALQQNRFFPALMFVTSGRFTTGVIREAASAENRMRLYLKDGVAVRDMMSRFIR